jgi:GNAT superfamily N-acetyltransferase
MMEMEDKTCELAHVAPALQRLPEIQLRSYRDGDFDAAYDVIRAIGEKHLGSDLRAWDKVFMGLTSLMWVAEVESAPIAFAGLLEPGDGLAYLHTDLVSPVYQRRGIGTLLTLTRFAAIPEDSVAGICVVATEHSAPFYSRFGFQLEAAPEIDPFGGHVIHRMSMPYARELGQSAEALLNGLSRVTFDITSFEDDPFAEAEQSR